MRLARRRDTETRSYQAKVQQKSLLLSPRLRASLLPFLTFLLVVGCATKVADATVRFTSLDPDLRVDSLTSEDTESLCVDGAAFQEIASDDHVRQLCAIVAFFSRAEDCRASVDACTADPSQALLEEAAHPTSCKDADQLVERCPVTIGALSACIVDKALVFHEKMRDPCAHLTADYTSDPPSCRDVTSHAACELLINHLVSF
jgi:hypothetical protein